MRILILHNCYQQRGGEDAVVEAEAILLEEAGHSVHVERVTNNKIVGLAAKANAFLRTPYDPARARWAEELTRSVGAEIVHVHNFFPLLTPAVHVGARRGGAAVVQTLHNYRLLCANALFLRDGKVCEKCLGGSNAWGVVHRCYRGSVPGSLALARMQWRAERRGTWLRSVDRFIALTNFAKSKFVEGGLPADLIAIKPNFVSDYDISRKYPREGGLFVGRLSSEKGVHILLEAWRRLPDVKLTIVGDGPDREKLESSAPPNVRFVGQLDALAVRQQMLTAKCLIMPSLWYEGFPMTALEAFAAELPVIASDIGSLTEIIGGNNGVLFKSGDPNDLAKVVLKALGSGVLPRLGHRARVCFEERYSSSRNLRMLEAIYDQALANRSISSV